jgi:hypothetical protein
VWGIDGASWNNKALHRISDAFQIRMHFVECHIDDSSNVFANNPSGPVSGNDSDHFRPEETVILFASSLPGCTEWLARKSPANKVNCSEFCSGNIPNISDPFYMRPMFRKHCLAKFIYLYLPNTFHTGTFKAKIKSPYTGKQ